MQKRDVLKNLNELNKRYNTNGLNTWSGKWNIHDFDMSLAVERIRKQIRGINLSDITMDLFERPIKSTRVRNGLYDHQCRNGCVNIDGQSIMDSV
ncbi:MAG: hypothetical protein IPP05_21895 [Cytophagaceae bacterium]|nr:hypothetical protein [Cytophagaceae bacterium]